MHARLKSKAIAGLAVILLAACAPDSDGTGPIEPGKAIAQQPAKIDPKSRRAFFGELHVHTQNSFDSYIFNNRVMPDDAYRFAKGEAIDHPSGFKMQLPGPPLDFAAVTDHGEYLGIIPALDDPKSHLSQLPIAKDLFGTTADEIQRAFGRIGVTIRTGKPIKNIYHLPTINKVWRDTVAAADRHYLPGSFTTFAAYEYTASHWIPNRKSLAAGNLHRNVIFKSAAPGTVFSSLNSKNPEDLWRWLDKQRAAGFESLAIPHNSNVSDGRMFSPLTYDGKPMDASYAALRARNEPLAEIAQVKGTSETHPALSPNDEWADFELYEHLIASNKRSKISGGFIREALARGAGMQAEKGYNPFKLGIVAATDSHVGGGAYSEKHYWSKIGTLDGSAEQRGSVPRNGAIWTKEDTEANEENWFARWAASGLAGIWAEENTRESLFGAMRRRETFGTSGPRMTVRFFAGTEYAPDILGAANMIERAYAGGVPMGGDIAVDRPPVFLASASADPRSYPLERVQIIKVWSDASGAREMISDIACAGGGIPDAQTQRCPERTKTLDLKSCAQPGKGANALTARWVDPDFDPQQHAVYYIRALEIPSCRWSKWDALKANKQHNPGLSPAIQERAWSSPIWTSPL